MSDSDAPRRGQVDKVYKVRAVSGSSLYTIDAIEWKGKLWLVPFWLDNPGKKETTPGRVIRFDNLRHSDVRGTSIGDFLLNDPLPKELLTRETPKQPIAGFEYEELPTMRGPEGDKTH